MVADAKRITWDKKYQKIEQYIEGKDAQKPGDLSTKSEMTKSKYLYNQ